MIFFKICEKAFKAFSNIIRLELTRLKKLIRRFYSQQHQLTSTTETNRYPELFEEIQEYALSIKQSPISILSFGCSTGEECFTLKTYFPNSRILGVDINNRNLRLARRSNKFADVEFLPSSQENITQRGKYHLIFCLSVLCRWDETNFVTNCSEIYPFEKFQETLIQLSNELLPGGYLIIYNSNFRLEDTVLADKYEIKTTHSLSSSGFVHKFDSFNRKVYETHLHCIYQKRIR